MKRKQKRKRKAIANRSRGMSNNYYFWRGVVKEPDTVQQFIDRGDFRQRGCIRDTLEYLRSSEPEYYSEIGGAKILKKLKESVKVKK